VQWSLRQVFIVTACVAIIVGAMVHRWPLWWRFAASQAALDQFADRVENGLQISRPQAVGWFMIERAEMRKGVPCLWTAPDLAGSTGFVRCAPNQAERFNLWSNQRLNDRWQFISED
jgi:hypothetical protein